MSTASPTFAEVLDSMRQMVGAPRGPAEPPTDDDTSPADGDAPSSPVSLGEVTAEPTDPQAPEVVTAEILTVPDPLRADAAPAAGSSAAALLELGVPTRLLSGVVDPSTPLPLSVLVRRFDRPPSVRLVPGGVVAVVGPPDLVLRTAQQFAARAGTDPHDVVLAGAMPALTGHGRRLQSASAVARMRARVPDDVPTILALGIDDDREGWAPAAAMLDAAVPTQAWAVVDARRKPVEVRRWVRAVGAVRAFDVLAACHVFDAQAPGTVLGLGIPVGWVDGLPATPVVWAAVLSERLADDARWD